MSQDLKQQWSRWWNVHPIWLATIAAFGATWFGARGFPSGNNTYHLPIVLDYLASAEGPHDAYHQTLENFISYFWQAVALISTEDNVRTVFLTLLIAGSIATVLGSYTIAVAAGASKPYAAVGAGFLAFAFSSREIMEFGGGEMLSGFVTHTQFATAVGLFAIALALRRRWVWAGLLCGLAADLNLFIGFWLTVNLLIARVGLGWMEQRRVPWIDCLKIGSVTLLAALPVLAWAFTTASAAQMSQFSFTEFLYETFPFHSFIHLELWYGLAFVALTATVWMVMRHRTDGAVNLLPVVIIASGMTVIVGAIAMYFSEHRMLQNLYPLRYAAIAHWLAAIGVLTAWSQAADSQDDNAAFGAIAMLGFALPTPAVTLLGLLLLTHSSAGRSAKTQWIILFGLAATLLLPAFTEGRIHFPRSPYIGPLPTVAVVSAAGSMLMRICGHRYLRDSWVPIALLWMTACTTLVPDKLFSSGFTALIVVIAMLMLQDGHRRKAMIAAAIGVALMSAYIVLMSTFNKTVIGALILSMLPYMATRLPFLHRKWQSLTVLGLSVALLSLVGITHGARLGLDFPRYDRDENWFDVQRWARNNTAPDTLFYAPVRIGFATMSRRPVWWDENEYAAVMWSPNYYGQWKSRRTQAEAVDDIEELVQLARAESIPYLVLSKRKAEDAGAMIELTYCNPDYCVARVNGGSASG